MSCISLRKEQLTMWCVQAWTQLLWRKSNYIVPRPMINYWLPITYWLFIYEKIIRYENIAWWWEWLNEWHDENKTIPSTSVLITVVAVKRLLNSNQTNCAVGGHRDRVKMNTGNRWECPFFKTLSVLLFLYSMSPLNAHICKYRVFIN